VCVLSLQSSCLSLPAPSIVKCTGPSNSVRNNFFIGDAIYHTSSCLLSNHFANNPCNYYKDNNNYTVAHYFSALHFPSHLYIIQNFVTKSTPRPPVSFRRELGSNLCILHFTQYFLTLLQFSCISLSLSNSFSFSP